MKKFCFLIVFVLFSAMGFTQDLGLSIPKLDSKSETTKMTLESANLQSNTYVVTKKTDRLSKKLKQAANSRSTYNEAYVFLQLNNGGHSVNRLTNVYISDYSTSGRGASEVEQFTIHFETSQPTQ
tara:strand:- start:4765 stop:5139 length:375 start_codon:yes stop_codon:yes gene_type:complete